MKKTPEMRRREAKRKERLKMKSDFDRFVEEFLNNLAAEVGIPAEMLLAEYDRRASMGAVLAKTRSKWDEKTREALQRLARPSMEKAMAEIVKENEAINEIYKHGGPSGF